ncbi:hypothetical protein F5Y18DRAFT_13853 [Xylariaceae sp. FL1019]|nr:hypothetical protein F5Y18DRAFT_13853 [Xylariaceae sp. FL1019]
MVSTDCHLGAGFSATPHATWRWSFYLIAPLTAIAIGLLVVALPSYSEGNEKSVSKNFREIDWIGNFLHIATFLLLAFAAVFGGTMWAWSSITELAVFIALGATSISYVVQQTFSLGVKPERRIIPVHLLTNRTVLFTWICTIAASFVYGVTLYYTPLFYAFTREIGPLEAGLRLFCFTANFIFVIFLAHSLLPVAKFYMPFFLVGGILLLIGGILFHTVTPGTSNAAILGFDALVGAGVGLLWNLAIPVCSVKLKTREERLDQTTLHSIAQLGGVAASLSASALIYQNLGLEMLRQSAQFTGYSKSDIFGLLSGAQSDILNALPEDLRDVVIAALIRTIVRCFYIIIAAGVLAFVASLCLKIEPLDFPNMFQKKRSQKDVEGSLEKPSVYELK